MPQVFTDADALAYVRAQTSIVNRVAIEAVQPEYPLYIPVVTDGSDFASSITFLSSEQAGKAGWINGNADDVPMADSKLSANVRPVHTAAIGYGYGWQEVNEAQMLGVNLRSQLAIAARRAYEEMVERIAFKGDATVDMTGLIDAVTGSDKVTSGTFDWETNAATAQDIVADLTKLVKAVGEGLTSSANTVVLPESELVYASTTFFTNSSRTALDYIRERWPNLRITGLTALESVGSGAGKNRYIAYNRSPDVLALHIPMPHRFLPVFQSGPLRYEVPGVFRLAGVNIARPEQVAYADGA